MNKISAIVVAKNSPKHLFESIVSIQNIVKEIVMIDIGLDQSVIAKFRQNKKIKIVEIKQDVPYVELIREEVKKYASEDYLLFIDPDEIFPEPLTKILSSKYAAYNYIKIPRKNIIFGKWIEHSRWWPDYQVRLFKKKAVQWPKQIHQQPVLSGDGYTVEPIEQYAILHYNYASVDEFMQKYIRYAKAEASELTSFSLTEALKKALSEFMSRYFAHEGYKDGMHGFVLAFLQMFYYFLVYVYYWEREKFRGDESNPPVEALSFFKNGFHETIYWLIQKKLITRFKKLKARIYNSLSRLI